jgi:putative Holliday junction resolvase
MIFYEVDDFKQNISFEGRLMALDIGTKRIGVAMCDDKRIIAMPKKIILRKSNEKDFATILSIIQENDVVAAVFGLPLKMNGEFGDIANFVMKFIKNFDEFLEKNQLKNFALLAFDERLSSFEARTLINKKPSRNSSKNYDDIAASLILKHLLTCLK